AGLSSTVVPNPVATPSTTTSYIVKVTDNIGAHAYDTIKGTVGQAANAMFSASTVCAGSPTTFTDLSTPAGIITAWAWDFNNNGTINTTNQNPTWIFAAPGIYPVKLTVTGPTLCTADTTINVVVQANPTSTFTATSPVCTGTNSTITYTGNVIVGATYNWNFNGGVIASGSSQGPFQVNWATAGTKNIVLSVNDNGCISTFTTVPVTVNSNLNIDSSVTTNITCHGGNDGSICIYVSGAPPFTYQWSNNSNTQCVTGAAVGSYVVTVTND